MLYILFFPLPPWERGQLVFICKLPLLPLEREPLSGPVILPLSRIAGEGRGEGVEWRQAYSTGGTNGDLTAFQKAKVLQPVQFAAAKFFPQPSFGFCHVFSELPGTGVHSVGFSFNPHPNPLPTWERDNALHPIFPFSQLGKERRVFLNAFNKGSLFFPPVEWRQAYSTGGTKGDLTAFRKAKVLPNSKFSEKSPFLFQFSI